jgi:hypothetical protein
MAQELGVPAAPIASYSTGNCSPTFKKEWRIGVSDFWQLHPVLVQCRPKSPYRKILPIAPAGIPSLERLDSTHAYPNCSGRMLI